jgi:hypothetical protein
MTYGHVKGAAADAEDSLLDRFIPEPEVVEHHQIAISAPADVVLAASATAQDHCRAEDDSRSGVGHAAGVSCVMAMPATEGFPPGCALIEVHISELQQIFNSLDPTPFRERDLDPKAEAFIADWARERQGDAPLGLLIHVDREVTSAEHIGVVQGAVRDYFAERAAVTRRQLRQLFRVGRTSLLIGLLFLAVSILLGNLAEDLLEHTRFAGVASESLLIGGWVAMWRPLEIFLYDWWPIRAEARLFDRLSAMTVRVQPSRSS